MYSYLLYFSPLLFCVLGSAHNTAKNNKPRTVASTIIDDDELCSYETPGCRPSTVIDGAEICCNKVPADICGVVDSHAGYVKFPANTMQDIPHDYPVNLFYWYFEAQNNPLHAPLVIWLTGGPGASSMFGLFTENGPCYINSSWAAEENEFSWNKDYNILYIDQPVQTGFSYDDVTDGYLDVETGDITPSASPPEGPTLFPGKFSSQNVSRTANTTENAARHFWNFLQVWTTDFPEYTTSDKSIHLWTESYGGRYGPSFAAYIHHKNSLIKQGSLDEVNVLDLTSLGIVNGCIDMLVQETSGPELAFDRNDYSIPALSREDYADALVAFSQKGGCLDKANLCLYLAENQDPDMYGYATEVNEVCQDASDFCQNEVEGVYISKNKWAFYDIAHCYLDAYPGNEFLDYLASEEVLTALGVPVNYTDISNTVGQAFNLTGDYARRNPNGYLGNIAELLDAGIQVSMVYGDRDFACNWIGGERASLAVNHTNADKFRHSGYVDVITDDPDPVGHVRQHGLFSFSRVFQSGHMVPTYQSKAAYTILRRSMSGKDIATGEIDIDDNYSTDGFFNSTATLVAPPVPSVTCYLRGLSSTCAEVQIEAVKDGSAVIDSGIITTPQPTLRTCPELPPSDSHLGSQGLDKELGHIAPWDIDEEL